MEKIFRDAYKNPLRHGLYFAGNGLDGNIYLITPNEQGFTAESSEGRISIENLRVFARQLIPFARTRENLRFAYSKLNRILGQ